MSTRYRLPFPIPGRCVPRASIKVLTLKSICKTRRHSLNTFVRVSALECGLLPLSIHFCLEQNVQMLSLAWRILSPRKMELGRSEEKTISFRRPKSKKTTTERCCMAAKIKGQGNNALNNKCTAYDSISHMCQLDPITNNVSDAIPKEIRLW